MKNVTTRLLAAVLFVLCFSQAKAQLADGSVAPDFTLTDINGTVHHLYDYLNQGKTVVIDISATWCGPCWAYHQSGELENLWVDHGPTGGTGVSPSTTNNVIVLLIEGDGTTTSADLHGTGPNTQGDWTAGTSHPIIDPPSPAIDNFNNDYQIAYFPTCYKICPNKLTQLVDQETEAQIYTAVQACPSLGVIASVAIASGISSNTICSGSSVTFTATPTNGGTPTYQWKVNGANVGTNSPTYTTSTLTNGAVVTCVMTSSLSGTTQATSNTITVTVNSAPSAPTVSSNSPVCAGSTVHLTASTSTGATYAWTGPNGFTSTSQNPNITTASSTMAGSYSLVVTANGCSSPASATALVVNSVPAKPTVTTNSPVCAGTTLTFTTPSVTGATYSWTGPSAYSSSTQNPSLNGSTTAMSGVYSLVITKNGCSSIAGTSTVTVNPSVTPASAVSITSGGNPTCPGQSVTFTANPTNGGVSPTYQWKVNGVNAGTNSPTFTPSSINNNDAITCVVTSNANCLTTPTATSAPITMSVTTNVVPALSIATSTTTICSGSSVTFTPTPTNGGTSPLYSWSVNGVSAGTGASFTSSSLTNGAVVSCVLTSSSGCASPATATSNAVSITVTPTVTPSLQVAYNGSGTSICQGNSATFVATPTNGGSSPSYNWLVNGVSTGVTSQQFQTSTLTNNAVVSCILTSNQACASSSTSISNTVTMTVNPTPVFAASSNSPICSGTDVNLSSTTLPGATYAWTGPNGYTSSQQNPVIPNATSALVGTYTLQITQNGCSSTNSTSVQVNNSPAVPTITANGNVLMSSATTGNQWLLNGVTINGAVNQFYTASQAGFYTVTTTQNGCSSTSAAFASSAGIEEQLNEAGVSVYPNPSNGLFTVKFAKVENTNCVVEVRNINGQLVENRTFENASNGLNFTIDLQNQGKGIYFMHILDGSKSKTFKLAVQ